MLKFRIVAVTALMIVVPSGAAVLQAQWTVNYCFNWSEPYWEGAYHFTVDSNNPPTSTQQNEMKASFRSAVNRWGAFVTRTLAETPASGLEVRLYRSGSSGLSPGDCGTFNYRTAGHHLRVSYGSHSLAVLFHELAHTYGLDHQTRTDLCHPGGTYDTRAVAQNPHVLTPSVGDFNALAACFEYGQPIGPSFSATATVPLQASCSTRRVYGRFRVNGYDVDSYQVGGVKWQYLRSGTWYDYPGSSGSYNFTVSTSSPGDGSSPYYVRFCATHHTGTTWCSSQVRIYSLCQPIGEDDISQIGE